MEFIATVLLVVQVIIFYKWLQRLMDLGDKMWIEPSVIALGVILQILLLANV